MRKPIIAVDCDDVLVPTFPLIIDHYNATYDTNIALKDCYSADPNIWQVSTKGAAIQRIRDYMMSAEYQTAAPFTQAAETLRRLSRHYTLHVVTGREDFLATATQTMLNEHFPGLFQSVEFTNFFGQTARPKSDVCQALGADILIDDHLYHAQIVAERGIEVLLFGDYPWNQIDELPANIRRVRDWREVARVLLPAESDEHDTAQ